MTKIVNAWNEWDPLKRLILGRPEGTQVAGPEPGLHSHQPEGGYPIGTYGPYSCIDLFLFVCLPCFHSRLTGMVRASPFVKLRSMFRTSRLQASRDRR